MKIIYYSPHPTHDIVSEVGYATHQREVINALKALGHQVLPVIMGGTDAQNLSPLAQDGYKPPIWKSLIKKCIPGFLWTTFNNYKLLQHDQRAAARLEAAIKDFGPELIYERSEYLQDSGARLASQYKIRYFLEVNAPFVEEMRSFEGYSLYESKAHRIEKFKLSKADKVIAVSTSLGDFLVKRYGCDPDKLFIQSNCINPEKINLDHTQTDAMTRTLNIAEEDKIIGFVGSMFPYHGVDILVEAFARINKRFASAKLMIVGDGIILNDLKQQVLDLGIGDKVIFTGKIPHSRVFNYIARMDICIMARSNWYGSPVKIFEYGLMNKPIIAPDTRPVTDVMVNGIDGLVIRDNANELEKAIAELLENTERASTMATHFHNKVLEYYTWESAAKNILQLCE